MLLVLAQRICALSPHQQRLAIRKRPASEVHLREFLAQIAGVDISRVYLGFNEQADTYLTGY